MNDPGTIARPGARGDIFADAAASAAAPNRRINLKPEDLKNGLAQLVLTLVKLLHELLERQAIRRIEGGALS